MNLEIGVHLQNLQQQIKAANNNQLKNNEQHMVLTNKNMFYTHCNNLVLFDEIDDGKEMIEELRKLA